MSFKLDIMGTEELKKAMREIANLKELKRAVRLNAGQLQKKAQDRVPKDTPFLVNTIRIDIDSSGMVASVEPQAEYAAYVEWGTRYMSAQPYMRPSYREQLIKFERDINKIMKDKTKGGK